MEKTLGRVRYMYVGIFISIIFLTVDRTCIKVYLIAYVSELVEAHL